MKVRVQVPLEHGVLFLHDAYGSPEIPSDTGAAPITFTESCIAFHVADYLEGEADVTLSNQPFPKSIPATFSQVMNFPSKYVSMTDVPANYYCILHLKLDHADINIWNYEERDSEKSWIQISNLDLF